MPKNRRFASAMIVATSLTALAACGSAEELEPAADRIDHSPPTLPDAPAASSSTVPPPTTVAAPPPDEWTQAVMVADDPIAVAYGLPDGSDLPTILFETAELKIAACMTAAGYDFEPELTDAAREANAATQNALPLEQRKRYNVTLYGPSSGVMEDPPSGSDGDEGCWGQAMVATYAGNADPEGFEAMTAEIRNDEQVLAADARYSECAGRSFFDPADEPAPAGCADDSGMVVAYTEAEREAHRAYALGNRALFEALAQGLEP